MGLKKFANITPAELKSKGVVSLANKPNASASYGVGGLSPTQLKLWFDKLATYLADKINAIQDTLSCENAGEFIRVALKDFVQETNVVSLQDLCASFESGKFAEYLKLYESLSASDLNSLQNIINNIGLKISNIIDTTALKDGYYPNLTVGKADSANSSVSAKSAASALISETSNYASRAGRAIADDEGNNIFETYSTKTELIDAISSVYSQATWYIDYNLAHRSIISCVSSLPSEGNSSKIYLIPKSNAENGNICDEYIWDGEKWELLGDIKISASTAVKIKGIFQNEIQFNDDPQKQIDSKYTKPSNGIPEQDLSEEVIQKLNSRDSSSGCASYDWVEKSTTVIDNGFTFEFSDEEKAKTRFFDITFGATMKINGEDYMVQAVQTVAFDPNTFKNDDILSSVGVAINMSTMEFFVVIVSFRMFFSGGTKANIIPSYIFQNATTNVTDIAVAVAEIKAFMGL